MPLTDGFVVDFPTLGDVGDAWVKQHCKVPDGFQRGADFAWSDWQYWCAANYYRVRSGVRWVSASQPLFNQAFTYRRAQVVAPQKALALDTPIATPGGWSTMADLVVGDFVFDEQGDPTEVVSKSPVWESDTYRVMFSDGALIDACKDHQWWVEWRKGPTWCGPVKVRTEDLLGGGQFRVPNAKSLKLPDADLSVDPYALGVNLGLSRMEGRGIPAEYLRASESQRLMLLEGLLDSASYEQRISIGGMDELWHSLGRSHNGAKSTFKHRRIVSVERIETVPTQCLTVASKSHVFLAGKEMIPTCNTGKGPWSASMACFEAVGPSQFLGWAGKDDGYVCSDYGCGCGWEYPYLPGEPMGMRHPSPVLQLTATSEDQVANVYRPLTAMIRLGPLSELLYVREGFIRIAGEAGGDDFDRIDAVSSSANGRVGNPVSWVLQDETGLYTKQNKMVKIADDQRRGAAGMGGRSLETTNAWDPAQNSYAQRTYESRVDDIFKFYRIPPKHLSWGNKRERRQILKYVYEGSPWVSLDSIEAEALELNETDPAQAERFFGNRLVYGQGSWLRDGLWESRYAQHPVMA